MYLSLEAFQELAGETRTPGQIWLLDYDTVGWVRCAFVAAHVWLAWGLLALRRDHAGWSVRGLVILVTLELATVYAITGWLALRGFSLPLY